MDSPLTNKTLRLSPTLPICLFLCLGLSRRDCPSKISAVCLFSTVWRADIFSNTTCGLRPEHYFLSFVPCSGLSVGQSPFSCFFSLFMSALTNGWASLTGKTKRIPDAQHRNLNANVFFLGAKMHSDFQIHFTDCPAHIIIYFLTLVFMRWTAVGLTISCFHGIIFCCVSPTGSARQ